MSGLNVAYYYSPVRMLCTQLDQKLDQYLGIALSDPTFGRVIELKSDKGITETLDLSSFHVKNDCKKISRRIEHFQFDFVPSSFFNGSEKGFEYITECFACCRITINSSHSDT